MSLKFLLRSIILGAPGSGKGTISNRLVRDFKLAYFAVGDCLREHIKSSTPLGIEAQKFIEKGKLVPDSIINNLVFQELKGRFDRKAWLLDGYPRTKDQAEMLLKQSKDLKPNVVINLVVPDDEIIERIKHRWVHLSSGRIYHSIYNPPKKPGFDDVTGEPLSQREDDKPETVLARLKEFHARNNEVVSIFRFRISFLCLSNVIMFFLFIGERIFYMILLVENPTLFILR
ncbi:GTP:AMP phosphotransferase AK3 [Sarcoptes scabiei]|nr:GTP:AMP phosphotransferase AK3 [Sarcoptes scabiei]